MCIDVCLLVFLSTLQKLLYKRNAPFHILISSYQLVSPVSKQCVCVCARACVCMYYPMRYLHIATSHVIKQAIIHVSLSKLSLYLIQCNYCFSRISSNLTDVQ